MKHFSRIVGIVIFASVSLLPIVWLILASIKTTADIVEDPAGLLPANPTIQNYEKLADFPNFLESLINSLLVAVSITPVVLLLAIFTSYLTERMNIWGHRWIKQLAIVSYVLPPVLLALPIFLAFAQLKLVNTLFGLAVAHILFVFPMAYWMLQARMREIPPTLEDGLRLDGANWFDLIRYAWFPLLRRHLVSIGGVVFVISMNDYVFARFLLVGDTYTLPLFLQDLYNLSNKDWGLICAAGSAVTIGLTLPFWLFRTLGGVEVSGGHRG